MSTDGKQARVKEKEREREPFVILGKLRWKQSEVEWSYILSEELARDRDVLISTSENALFPRGTF